MQAKKYKFSVIIPIYNAQEYLEEAIKSIINQSIGFKENIQLILVNDGSTDKSEKICIKYRDDYPENVVYIKQENQGVSAARNAGIEHIQGEYVNFLDSDDNWNYDAFDLVYNFFEKHKDEIDVVSCRIKFFEGKEGYHPLDYKFEENAIIDIKEKYDYIQLSTATAFVKVEVIQKYKYDTELKYSEDAVLMSQILMNKLKYGILVDAVYNYRKRKTKTSALQIRDKMNNLYFDLPELKAYEKLIKQSTEEYGQVLTYFQYLIMYNLQWKIKKDISTCLSEKEKDEYLKKLKEILQNIDDNIIMEQKSIWSEYKILTLSLKHEKDIRQELEYKDGNLYFNNVRIYKLERRVAINVKKINVHRRSIVLTGRITYYLPKEDYKLYVNINDTDHLINKYRTFKKEPSIIGELNHYREFRIKIPIKSKNTKIKFVIDYKGNKNNLYQKFEEKEESQTEIAKKKLGVSVKGEKGKIVVKKRRNIFK